MTQVFINFPAGLSLCEAHFFAISISRTTSCAIRTRRCTSSSRPSGKSSVCFLWREARALTWRCVGSHDIHSYYVSDLHARARSYKKSLEHKGRRKGDSMADVVEMHNFQNPQVCGFLFCLLGV